MIVDPDFLDHWKTRTLVGLLGNDELAPLYVIRIWAHCQNRRQDRFQGMSALALVALCRFTGSDPQAFERALTDSGFISREGDTLIVNGWHEKNASLFASWTNGKLGGRPKTHGKTHGPPDKRREEKIREEPPPLPPQGGGSQQPEGEGGGEILIQGIKDLDNWKRLVAWLEAGCAGLEKPIDPTLAVDVIAHAQECLQKEIKRPLQLFWKKMRRLADTGRYDGPMEFYTEARAFMARRPKE